MAANGDMLATLLKAKLNTNYIKAYHYQSGKTKTYPGPLAQKNPAYYHEFCEAIGKGLILGQPTINFLTVDKGVGVQSGSGMGLGIKINRDYMFKKLYIDLRQATIDAFGKTNHPEWPATIPEFTEYPGDQYNYLHALAEAITDSVKEHHETLWTLSSSHPNIYVGAGKIEKGMFIGVVPSGIESTMIGLGANMKGPGWPVTCKAISAVYADVIQTQSTGEVVITGSCSGPNCGIPQVGTGTGVAS